MPSLNDCAQCGNAAKVTKLLQRGRVSPEDFMYAFTHARYYGRTTVVEVFLANGGKQRVNEKDKNGVAPLCDACYRGRHEVVYCLLSSGGLDMLNVPSNAGRFPLSVACQAGYTSMVQMLLAAGADPHQKFRTDGIDAAAVARKAGNTACAELVEAAQLRPQRATEASGEPPAKRRRLNSVSAESGDAFEAKPQTATEERIAGESEGEARLPPGFDD
eukprot:NODE_4651_length_763_cov_42.982704_g4628_i0.p1 GENE.NODE_4651_length_763_cov_42.982704_g4628_i0~~NODE_4651_length_763_cov_42.982704_g4628_i0.p1  ORF type:complete len:217 (+),score=30.57 NODE_4651_length_763_cov_42.982704_g4628_i0:69-719(+)